MQKSPRKSHFLSVFRGDVFTDVFPRLAHSRTTDMPTEMSKAFISKESAKRTGLLSVVKEQ